MFEKFFDFVRDKRMPYYLPNNLFNWYSRKKMMKDVTVRKIFVSITFDVEAENIPNYHIKNFFEGIIKDLGNKKATFFICGNLISKFSYILKKIQSKHEIGLHGFAHELWGDEKWWAIKKPIDYEQKGELLKLCLDIFKENRLRRPISFRAPYLITNHDTFKLLKKNNFRVDSSLSSYLGNFSLPVKFFKGKIMSIPVSVNPLPKVSFQYLIPYTSYESFNWTFINNLDKNNFINFINSIFSWQIFNKIQPHLVFLAHSYQVVENDKKLKYSHEKSEKMFKLFSFLEKNYQVEYVTLRKLAERL